MNTLPRVDWFQQTTVTYIHVSFRKPCKKPLFLLLYIYQKKWLEPPFVTHVTNIYWNYKKLIYLQLNILLVTMQKCQLLVKKNSPIKEEIHLLQGMILPNEYNFYCQVTLGAFCHSCWKLQIFFLFCNIQTNFHFHGKHVLYTIVINGNMIHLLLVVLHWVKIYSHLPLLVD